MSGFTITHCKDEDAYVGRIPKFKVSTPTGDAYGDFIVGENGVFWRSMNEDHYRFQPWEALKHSFETNGISTPPVTIGPIVRRYPERGDLKSMRRKSNVQ